MSERLGLLLLLLHSLVRRQVLASGLTELFLLR